MTNLHHACVLWLKVDGEVYSPETYLERATVDTIARDIWSGEHMGVCQAVIKYRIEENGGSFVSDVTREVAEQLGQRSRRNAETPPSTDARLFLDEMGVDYFDDGSYRRPEVFEVPSAPAPAATVAKAPRKRTRKPLSPEELRAQPQFKLPIAGGKAVEDNPAEADVPDRKAG